MNKKRLEKDIKTAEKEYKEGKSISFKELLSKSRFKQFRGFYKKIAERNKE